ncbi:class I SAM-dependent methyltransferase [Pseudalkalibacillus berkeleyi]|uniref:Class I SAM-dependent methyltransferase n=1 Tax=Pseudalkalibacillus berkeleyi TaxID=1069813 RepID=A0ABS9H4X7_9BACL|nr:class I SAM-dependent methyltransferase [Pseudalkalibacillus berkeleyi]MCF6139020.1 class I SAM-dependent methyltransferase [Pseudalkalibacillus berkeleyi]
MSTYWTTIHNIASTLIQHSIPYQFIDETGLAIQGLDIEKNEVHVEVQWDQMESVHDIFEPYTPTTIERTNEQGRFTLVMEGTNVVVICRYNTALRTDPYRIEVKNEGVDLWCQSLYALTDDRDHGKVVQAYLSQKQKEMTEQNESAWNQNNYQALVNRFGEPETAASKIKKFPEGRIGSVFPFLDNVKDKKIAHLMGSNGIKATALSLLGAEVTVVDFSKENAAFAKEVAKECDVEMNYLISDVLSLKSNDELRCQYDIVLMELGVLHYFIDLNPLFQVIHQLLKPGGRFILQEFHPISTKLITSKGKKHKVDGNYFDPTLERRDVAFSKYATHGEKKEVEVLQRKWTLGEVVTSVAQQGLTVKVLKEEPNQKVHDIGLPKMFTLIAEK